jgi:hypothetical protein
MNPIHPTHNSRRQFFAGAAASVAGLAVARSALAGLPEPVIQTSVHTAPPLVPNTGRPYNPVVTLNGWTLPWRMNNGVKEFHLVAEPVVREVMPGLGQHVGLQRPKPRPHHRGGRGRPRAPVRHQQACPSTPPSTGTASACPAAWTVWAASRSRKSGGQDLRVRVRGPPPRHLHVPPACRRDDADGDGHDGHVGDAPQGQTPAYRTPWTATSASC